MSSDWVHDVAREAREKRVVEIEQRRKVPQAMDIADIAPIDDSDTRRYETGLPNVDRRMHKWRAGELVVIGARQGAGKSALVESVANNVAILRHVVFAALDMPAAEVRERMIARIIGKSLDETERLRMFSDDEYRSGFDAASSLMLKFYDPDPPAQRTSQAVMRMAEAENADMLIVDHMRCLVDWEVGNAHLDGSIVRAFKMFARRTKIVTVLVSQLHRDAQNKRPLESNLQDTGALEQESDRVLLLHRPFKYASPEEDVVAEIIVAKNRRGPTFMAHTRWNGPTMSFEAMSHDEELFAPCCAGKSK